MKDSKFFKTYLDICHNRCNLITLAEEELELDLDLEEEPAELKLLEKKAPLIKTPKKKPLAKDKEADLKFSIDLATEFSNTVNQFTVVCSKIVLNRMVDKLTSDKVYNLMGKVKDLLDAASKTE